MLRMVQELNKGVNKNMDPLTKMQIMLDVAQQPSHV